MSRMPRENDINAWWNGLPGERYWLDTTDREGRDQMLASPRGEGRDSDSWSHRLITHVRGGDVVFHYDATQQAIVAMSMPHGRVEKRQLWWPVPAEVPGDADTRVLRPSWGIALRQSTELSAAVSLQEIARTQWDQFPSLRALEDEAGDPLYYPFEIGNPAATQPLSGFVFKLPALLVREIPALARAADQASRQAAAKESARSPHTATVPHAASR
jgi:hypothetical protein